jgi:2-oxoglutarate/2-oxoacid ferredoxin oxidoreductase subunit alpha
VNRIEQNIVIGGAAGQGINKVSAIITELMSEYGYYTFNYRDYPSLIRGGHNFNVISISKNPVNSNIKNYDMILALDKNTEKFHKRKLKRDGKIISSEKFKDAGRNLNLLMAVEYLAKIGFPKKIVEKKIEDEFGSELIGQIEKIYGKYHRKNELPRLKIKKKLLTGSEAIAIGAVNSGLNLYVAYPMTPSTGVLHSLGGMQNDNFMVFQGESEIGCVSMALGASFAGKISMTGTSGGGFDLMGESLSMQGQSEIPLCVYLSSRPGPATGVPTYTAQADLDIALRAGHGEFPRFVVAPGDANDSVKYTNEALYLTYKHNILGIVLGDKHLAESGYSYDSEKIRFLKAKQNRDLPNKKIVKASSYEQNKYGNTTESARTTKKNMDLRMKKYIALKKDIEKNSLGVKFYGRASSKNLIVGWGSTKGAIIDSIKGLDVKFMQVVYVKPLSKKVKLEMKKAKNIILIENNQTGQLGRLLREATGISIKEKNRILKYDGRPFFRDELREEIEKRGIKKVTRRMKRREEKSEVRVGGKR